MGQRGVAGGRAFSTTVARLQEGYGLGVSSSLRPLLLSLRHLATCRDGQWRLSRSHPYAHPAVEHTRSLLLGRRWPLMRHPCSFPSPSSLATLIPVNALCLLYLSRCSQTVSVWWGSRGPAPRTGCVAHLRICVRGLPSRLPRSSQTRGMSIVLLRHLSAFSDHSSERLRLLARALDV